MSASPRRRAVVAVLALVLSAGAAVLWYSTREDPGATVLLEVEERLRRNDEDGARKILVERARLLRPAQADYARALLLFREGTFDGAAEAAGRSVAEDPSNWRAVSLRFYALVRLGRPEEAHRVLTAYRTLAPKDERALVAEAQYWVEVRTDAPDPRKALELLAAVPPAASRTAPPGDPTAITDDLVERIRAAAEELRGRNESARRAAEARTHSRPDDPEGFVDLGEICRRTGDLEGARKAFREAVRLAPGNTLWTERLVLLLLETDETGPEALPLARSLVSMRPERPEYRVLEARSLVRVKDGEPAAIEIYRDLLKQRIPDRIRMDVLRNLAVALYDFKQGGQDGDYLDEAHRLLAEYVRRGGVVDDRLLDPWTRLEERARAKGAATPPPDGGK